MLTLKVMRLARPSYASYAMPELPLPSANIATVPLTASSDNQSDGIDGIDDLLLFPNSFGNIYLGETFSAYLCVNNDSGAHQATVRDVAFKAELQTQTQRFSLSDTSADPAPPNMLPNQTLEFVISHEVKELGVHVLLCSVTYAVNTAVSGAPQVLEKKSFRKLYKFQVINPLAVKTKINSALTDGRLFLEAQLQNVTPGPMLIEHMILQPAETYQCTDLNLNDQPEGGIYLSPQDVRQFLFLVTAVDKSTPPSLILGKLDIVWRTTMGEVGRLQTSTLTRKPPKPETIDVQVSEMTSEIYLEVPFTLKVLVTNTSSLTSSVILSAIKAKMGNVLMVGSSSVVVGELHPGARKVVDLRFFPLTPGIHKIEGIRATDVYTGASLDINSLAEIFVMRPANK